MDTVGCKLKVLYDFEYETKDKRKICITRGEKLFLIRKTNHDWWQVIKNSSERPFFVPAPYVIEASASNVEDSYVDNPIYGKPPDLGLVCDCGKASDIGGITNVPYIKHNEEEEKLGVHQNYLHPTTIEGDFHTVSVDGCEASSSCESGTEKNVLLENSGLAHGEDTKSALGNYLLAETQQCALTLPCNENPETFTDENPVAALTFTLSSDKREILRTNMAENNSCDVSKETSNVNIGKIKSKLAKSRSFKTRNELQKISRLDPDSVVLLPVERTVVKPDRVLETFSTESFNKNNKNCDLKVGDVYESAIKEQSSQLAPALVTVPVPVPLVFHNELYNLSNSQDGDTNKTMDSGNISSESLFTHEEDISDSGASHKSGLISSAQSRESIHEHSDLLADDTSKEELESSREEIYFAEDYEGVPIPQGWSRVYDEDSGEYCYINEVTHAKVCFSDESVFTVMAESSRYVRWRPGEAFKSECMLQFVKHPTSIMVWSVMSVKGTGRLLIVEGTMRQDQYKKILEKELFPQIREWFPNEDAIFMHDGVPCHKAKSVSKYLEEKQLKVFSWPGNSTDMTPIENVWGIVKRRIRKYK